MKSIAVTHVSTYDSRGGAGIAATRTHKALRAAGVSSRHLVRFKSGNDPHTYIGEVPDIEDVQEDIIARAVQAEYIDKRRSPVSNTLFSLGYPGIDIGRHPLIVRSDVINLHWVTSFLSIESIGKLLHAERPVVWTLHDQWAFTGGCHYTAGCEGFTAQCSACPQLESDPDNLIGARLADRRHAFNGGGLTLIAPSEWMRQSAMRSSLFRDAEIFTIPNAVPVDIFAPGDKEKARRSLGIDPAVPCILFGADNHAERRKGFSILMEALKARLDDSASAAALKAATVLCFGEPARELVETGLRIVSLGRIEDQRKLRTAYIAADLFVLPSLEDNLPNTVLEAQACGIPVLAFSSGGVADAVRHNETGWLVPAGDIGALGASMTDILGDAGRLKAWSMAARKFAVENFSPSVQSRRYLNVYETILQRSAKGGPHIRKPYRNDRAVMDVSRGPAFDAIYPSVSSHGAMPAYVDLVREHRQTEIDRYARSRQIETLTRMLRASEVDRSARAEQITLLTRMLHKFGADRGMRAPRTEPLSATLRHVMKHAFPSFRRTEQIEALTQTLQESEKDRAARAEQIKTLTRLLRESEARHAVREEQIESLAQTLRESEIDRAARAEQIDSLTGALRKSEKDHTARAEQIETLARMLRESEADRAARAEQIETLTLALRDSEADRAARAEQTEILTRMLRESEDDRLARAGQIETLNRILKESEAKPLIKMLQESEDDRTMRAEQIETLTRMLKESEMDRMMRAEQIEVLTGALQESETDRNARAGQAEMLALTLRESETDRTARAGQIETLTRMLQESEDDRLARSRQIEALTDMLRESEASRVAQAEEIEALAGALKEAGDRVLMQRLRESEADRDARIEQNESLMRMLGASESHGAAREEQIEAANLILREMEADCAARAKQIEAMQAAMNTLSARPLMRWMLRLVDWPELKNWQNGVDRAVQRSLRTIAVDLTPILPGGENGGAKIFVLKLLQHLAEMAPQTQFVLLTQAASHEELTTLDRPNMRRLMAIGPAQTSLRRRGVALALRVMPRLPARLKAAAGRLGYSLNAALKRGRAATLLRDINADLLFCPFTAPTYYEPGIPTVCTIYDLQYKAYPEFFPAEDIIHRDRAFMEACRRASALAAISDYSRVDAIAYGGLDPARIRTIYLRMAQRMAPATENGKNVLDRLGLAPQRYLIYPANFWKHKNHEILLTAFGMACRAGLPPDIKLVCTGAPGERQKWLMSAARMMNMADRILFPGYLPHAELAALMAHSGGVVFPSLYEGFGLPVIEAMAAGVPAACSNTTSLPEVAAHAAIFFDPRIPAQIAEAMVALVGDEALRAQFIQAGRQRAAEFSDSESMAREYWDLFQYAVTNKEHRNMLTGAYADGWAGPALNIQVAPAVSEQNLRIEFSVPAWLPQSSLKIQASFDGKPRGVPFEVVRGSNAVWSMPLRLAGGYYEVRLAPTFVPAHSGHGDDQRELSGMLHRCSIERADGECIELFPQKVSA